MTTRKKALVLAGLAAVGFGIYKNPAMVQTGFAMLKTAGTAIASLFAGVSFGMMASAVAGIAVLGLVVYKVRGYRAAKAEGVAKATKIAEAKAAAGVDKAEELISKAQPPLIIRQDGFITGSDNNEFQGRSEKLKTAIALSNKYYLEN